MFSFKKLLRDNTGTISDVYNAAKWKNLERRGWFQSSTDIGILMSTDGGALFKSCGVQAWPVWGVVINLPPAERCVCKCICACDYVFI